MRNKIENFIKENRTEMDMFQPREALWDSIHEKLTSDKKHKNNRFRVLAVAASIVVLMVCSFLFVKNIRPAKQQEVVQLPAAQQEAEVYFSSLIEVKKSELNKYKKENPELCKEFEKQIETLNVLYGQLKTEYKASAKKEVVISAMIENLQTQIQILNQQLLIIQQVKKQKSKANEKINV
jgi:hypothetical protein